MLRIPWIAHRINSSIWYELHQPMNWPYTFVRCQKLKYFGHVTRHNGLEKTIMQGMVARQGKEAEESPAKIGERHHIYSDTMATGSRVAVERHRFSKDIWEATS